MNWLNPTNISAFAALCSAVAAIYSCKIALRSQEPDIVVYIDQDPDAKDMLFLCVTNFGQLTAHDIEFKFNQRIPYRASNKDDTKKPLNPIPIKNFLTKGFFIKGLTHLAPNKTRRIFLGHYAILEKHFSENELTCNITYISSNSFNPFKKTKTIKDFFQFSISDWAHDPIGDNSHLKGIKDALVKIAEK